MKNTFVILVNKILLLDEINSNYNLVKFELSEFEK